MAERSAEDLLVHAGWLRALALRLVRDEDGADDLVQETWVATMRRAPERSDSEKSWLAKVMLNRLRMRARADGRRSAREQASLLVEDRDVPTQDVLLARAEMQRKLVELVLRLDEPYRTTVLLHYCEGVPLATIARTEHVAASTVRWRLKTALDQLREGLDRETGGRKQWAVPLLAFPKGVLVAQKTSKLVALAIVLLLLIVGGLLFQWQRGHDTAPTSATTQASAATGRLTTATGQTPMSHGATAEQPAWLIQPDVKPRRIAGRVTFSGAPVLGATVELASIATESGLGPPPRRTTSATGEFDFGEQPAMEFSVRASAPHRASAMLAVDLRDPTTRPERLELTLGACDAAMFGTVRDASGGAIAKAHLATLHDGPKSAVMGGPSVVADENGAYELCVETRWPPSVAVEVSAAGYGSIVYTATVPGRTKIDFALVPEATIVGRVIRDDTREPVAQALVYVPAGPGGVERNAGRATFSDAMGRFRIDRLAPGSHVVFARAEGLADSVQGVPVVLDAGQTSAEIEVHLAPGSTIRGTVVDGTKLVSGARITAGPRSAYSQGDGAFVLTGVPYGEVAFGALPYEVLRPKSLQVTQSLHDGVKLEVESLGTITGRVVRGGDPVPGAALYLDGPNGRELDAVIADSDGRFIARGLRAGPWNVAAGSQQLGAFGLASPPIVELARGQTVDVTIDMNYSASIAGRVVDQNGAPIPGVTVGFIHTAANDIGLATTALDGSFRAATMTGGGQYRAYVSAIATPAPWESPLRPASGTPFPLIALADGSSAVTGIELAVRLDKKSISGTVVDADGNPVSDTRVVAELTADNAAPQFAPGLQAPTATTDVDGHFLISDLLDETYALRARSATGIDGTLLGVHAGRDDVTLVLPSAGSIDVTLVGFKTPPQVTAMASGSHWSNPPLQGRQEGNVVQFRNLAPGRYLVTARTPSEGASQRVEVTGRTTTRITLASKGSSTLTGHVREFRSGKPVEGMTCRAVPRVGTEASMTLGDGARTDTTGAFTLEAPVGEIAVWCDGLSAVYSEGMRLITVAPNQHMELDVPVVGWNQGTWTVATFGAEIEFRSLVPNLTRVQPHGPAAQAGFLDGDLINRVDDRTVAELSPQGIFVLIVNRAPGAKVKLEATRAAKTIVGEVTLAPQ